MNTIIYNITISLLPKTIFFFFSLDDPFVSFCPYMSLSLNFSLSCASLCLYLSQGFSSLYDFLSPKTGLSPVLEGNGNK